MKLFRNRTFLICLCVALVLTIVPTTWGLMGKTELITAALNTLATPFRAVGKVVSNALNGYKSYFTSVKRLQAENESLKEQIRLLESRQSEYDRLEYVNRNLRRYLQVDSQIHEYTWSEATVVATGEQQLVLNRGSESGLLPDMPVITGGGVLGRITASGKGWSFVQPLSSTRSQNSAMVARSGALGVVQGLVSSPQTGLCEFMYLQENADICEGDVLITSGKGSIFPQGLLVGVVEQVVYDEIGRTPVATIRIQADLSSPSFVLVMTGEIGND